MEKISDKIPDDRCREDMDETRNHEGVVKEIFTDDRSSRPVEVDSGDVGWIVGDEEIAIDRRHHAQEHPTVDAERIGQRKHRDYDSTLAVDKHGDEEESNGLWSKDRP